MLAARSLLAQRHLALLLCVATLLLKLLVPTGYMVSSEHGRLSITVCAGVVPRAAAMGTHAMHGDTPDRGKSEDHGKAEMPCSFAGLSAAALGAIDTIQLAALLAFVMAAGVAGLPLPPPRRRAHLRPPLRGPPVHL